MITSLLIASSLLFCNAKAQQGFDMDDEDFAMYLESHDNFRNEYGETAMRGCVKGAAQEAYKGFAALCIGCAKNAFGSVVEQMTFPKHNERE